MVAIATMTLAGTAQVQKYAVGDVVAKLTVKDTDGNTHHLHTITASGKHVIIDFFFDTCGPCQAVSPVFNELYDKYGCNSGDLYCLTMKNGSYDNAEVEAFESTYGGTFNHAPAIISEGGAKAVNTNFNPTAYPTICMIGPDNKVISLDIWPASSIANF